MQQCAIISDVHGHLPALEAVLRDIHQRDIRTIYCLGDLVGKGPDSAATFDRCLNVCEVIVRGNWDVFIGAPSTDDHVVWQQDQLGSQRLDTLRKLPGTHDFTIGSKRVRLLHASQISENHRIRSYAPYEVHLEMFQNTDFTGYDTPTPDVVIYGDIHIAFMQSLYREQFLLINAGSAGNPLDMPLATYVILHAVSDAAINVEFVRIPYDIERAVQDAYDRHMPEAEPYAAELRTAIYRGRSPR